MQIPQNIISTLSAKGKGYVEAAMKIAEGLRLQNEGRLEMAHLDGKKISTKERMHAGGVDVMSGVRDLAKPKMTPAYLKAFLKAGPLSSRELATQAGCSSKHARDVMAETDGVHVVGSGNQVKWSLAPATSRINKKKTFANRTLRKTRVKVKSKRKGVRSAKTRQQAECRAADPEQQKADEDKIVALLKATPGVGIGVLMKKLKRSFYPIERAIKSLVKSGRLEESTHLSEKTGRKLTTWVPVAHGA
jgi:predicted HTH transcriptional regulator